MKQKGLADRGECVYRDAENIIANISDLNGYSMREKPGLIYDIHYSSIWKVELINGRSGETTSLAFKYYHLGDRLYEKTYRMKSLLRKHFKQHTGFHIPAPIMYSDKMHLLVMEYIPGQRLDKIIRRKPVWITRPASLVDYIKNAAHWLSILHSIKDQAIETESYSLDELDIEATIGESKERIVNMNPDHILNELSELKTYLNTGDISLTHRDYVPWNILYTKYGITVLDFDSISYAYREMDIAQMYVALSVSNVIGLSAGGARYMQSLFLSSYPGNFDKNSLRFWIYNELLKTLRKAGYRKNIWSYLQYSLLIKIINRQLVELYHKKSVLDAN